MCRGRLRQDWIAFGEISDGDLVSTGVHGGGARRPSCVRQWRLRTWLLRPRYASRNRSSTDSGGVLGTSIIVVGMMRNFMLFGQFVL